MKKAVFILSILMLFAMAGCTNMTTPEPVTTNKQDDTSTSLINESPDVEKDYLEIGFALMTAEKIGGVYCSMAEADVIQLLGEPSTKETPELWGADGLFHWNYIYSEIGLTINFANEADNSGRISSYYIESSAFDGSTARGIHIGSRRQEVLDAYENEIDFSDMSPDANMNSSIVVGSVYGGLIFGFSDNGEVISIFMGASAE